MFVDSGINVTKILCELKNKIKIDAIYVVNKTTLYYGNQLCDIVFFLCFITVKFSYTRKETFERYY